MDENQLLHYQAKLEYETDSWDLYVALKEGKPWVVIDGRAVEAYEQEHIRAPLICRIETSPRPQLKA